MELEQEDVDVGVQVRVNGVDIESDKAEGWMLSSTVEGAGDDGEAQGSATSMSSSSDVSSTSGDGLGILNSLSVSANASLLIYYSLESKHN